jgi:predicted metal-binding membrane protein
MWVVMIVAMMLPSLVPMLWRYRQAVGRTGETRLGRLSHRPASAPREPSGPSSSGRGCS